MESVEKVKYIESILDNHGKINKARIAYNMLKNISKSSEIPNKTKIRICSTNVKNVLL